MIVLLHVAIALLSVLYTAYVLMSPSQTKLSVSYGLVGMTIASGTYLTVMAPAHMVEACMAGLFYTVVMLVSIVAARRKLVHAQGLASKETNI